MSSHAAACSSSGQRSDLSKKIAEQLILGLKDLSLNATSASQLFDLVSKCPFEEGQRPLMLLESYFSRVVDLAHRSISIIFGLVSKE